MCMSSIGEQIFYFVCKICKIVCKIIIIIILMQDNEKYNRSDKVRTTHRLG